MLDRLLRNYALIEEKLAKACLANGRRREDVTIVAVSKFHPAEAVAAVALAGQIDFGENYVQEALDKRRSLADTHFSPDLRWHMIGHVQSRKASLVAGNFDLIHTLDSIKLANSLERHLASTGKRQKTLLEVNIANEPNKTGIAIAGLVELAIHVMDNCPSLDLRGLMCMPPVFDAGAAARPYFAKLRGLRDSLERETGLDLPELSMGMSGDFVEAVAEGATLVRVGTGIFGPRPPKMLA